MEDTVGFLRNENPRPLPPHTQLVPLCRWTGPCPGERMVVQSGGTPHLSFNYLEFIRKIFQALQKQITRTQRGFG